MHQPAGAMCQPCVSPATSQAMCQPCVSQQGPCVSHQPCVSHVSASKSHVSTGEPEGEPGESPAALLHALGALVLGVAPPTSVATAPAVTFHGTAPNGSLDEATPASAPATVVSALPQVTLSIGESLAEVGAAASMAEATDHGATSAEATDHAATSAEATDHAATSASVLTEEASAPGSTDASWRLVLPTPEDMYQAKAANTQQMY